MNPEFSKWYRSVRLCPSEKEIKQRWRGIKEFKKTIEQDDIHQLVLLAFLLQTSDEFRRKFNSGVGISPKSGNDAECAILSGALLANLMNQSLSKNGILSALMISTCSFKGMGRKPLLKDLSYLANNYIKQSASQLLKNPLQKEFNEIKLDIVGKKQQILNFISTNQPEEAEEALNKLISLIKSKNTKQNRRIESLSNALKGKEEEIRLLMSLFKESHDEFQKPFNEKKFHKRIITLGYELSETTSTHSGWIRADYYLYQTIMMKNNYNTKKTSIKDISQALPKTFIKEKIKKPISHNHALICPLHYCLESYVKSSDIKQWEENCEKISGVSMTYKFFPGNLARQYFQERIILNELGEER